MGAWPQEGGAAACVPQRPGRGEHRRAALCYRCRARQSRAFFRSPAMPRLSARITCILQRENLTLWRVIPPPPHGVFPDPSHVPRLHPLTPAQPMTPWGPCIGTIWPLGTTGPPDTAPSSVLRTPRCYCSRELGEGTRMGMICFLKGSGEKPAAGFQPAQSGTCLPWERRESFINSRFFFYIYIYMYI